MSPLQKLSAYFGYARNSLSAAIQEQQKRNFWTKTFPGVDWIWPVHFVNDEPEALIVGNNVVIGPFVELVILRQSTASSVPGSLHIGSGSRIGTGSNLRAAGGSITLGERVQLGQNVCIVASNHARNSETLRVEGDRWDESKTGVEIGDDAWIGAQVIILPGVHIGKNAVIGAGSVVTRSVPAGERWAGSPAKSIEPGA